MNDRITILSLWAFIRHFIYYILNYSIQYIKNKNILIYLCELTVKYVNAEHWGFWWILIIYWWDFDHEWQSFHFYLIPPLLMLGARQRPFPRTSNATPLYLATPFASVHKSGSKRSHIRCLGFNSFSGTPAHHKQSLLQTLTAVYERFMMSRSYRGNSGKWLCRLAEH